MLKSIVRQKWLSQGFKSAVWGHSTTTAAAAAAVSQTWNDSQIYTYMCECNPQMEAPMEI
jgi:hypothetical protein